MFLMKIKTYSPITTVVKANLAFDNKPFFGNNKKTLQKVEKTKRITYSPGLRKKGHRLILGVWHLSGPSLSLRLTQANPFQAEIKYLH